jgi:hypothetical protein
MTFTLRADVALTDTESAMVLLDERDGRYFQLNSTGALVLRQLLAGAAAADVASSLVERYVVDAERAAAEVTALVERLRSAGLTAGAAS